MTIFIKKILLNCFKNMLSKTMMMTKNNFMRILVIIMVFFTTLHLILQRIER